MLHAGVEVISFMVSVKPFVHMADGSYKAGHIVAQSVFVVDMYAHKAPRIMRTMQWSSSGGGQKRT